MVLPTGASNQYSASIVVAANGTIKAIATKSGMTASSVGTASYIINSPWQTFGTVGGGNGTNQFSFPSEVALDANGHIYVLDGGNNRIVRVEDMSGSGWTTLGTLGSGTNQFLYPTGIAVDAIGHIYIADAGNGRIVRINDMSGTGWTALGTPGSGTNQFNTSFFWNRSRRKWAYLCR